MFRRNTSKARPARDPRVALVHALADAGTETPSACGTCGAAVRTDDLEAVQTYGQEGRYPYHRQVRSWRYHRACSMASDGPELLALVLDPDARPVRVTRAHADVARQLGAPLAYAELETSAPEDPGRRNRFRHVSRNELAELRAAVERRHQELTEPAPHPDGRPCGICGTSHELADRWDTHDGWPVCDRCARMVAHTRVPGNQRLEEFARSAAWNLIPPRRVINPFPLAWEMPGYVPLGAEERREPWAYVLDLPEIPPTPEERLAELESRLTGVTA